MKIKFNVSGMTCAACSARVEKVTQSVPGVKKAEVNLLAGTMQTEVENDRCVDQIIRAVSDAGYSASMEGQAKPTKEKRTVETDEKAIKTRIIVSAVFLLVLMYFTMGHMLSLPMPSWYEGREDAMVAVMLQFFLTLPPVILNRSYYTRGLKALWHRSPNMDSLIAVGSLAALIYGVAALFRMAWAVPRQKLRNSSTTHCSPLKSFS